MTQTTRKTPEGYERFHPINVSPFATNVIELIGLTDLETRMGTKVEVRRSSGDFLITYTPAEGDVQEFRTNNNLQASYILNTVGDGVGQFAI